MFQSQGGLKHVDVKNRKTELKGTRFATIEYIKSNATAELRRVPKEAFHRWFQQWQERWSKCVCAQGSYFEGD
jgi:hypothetical protein